MREPEGKKSSSPTSKREKLLKHEREIESKQQASSHRSVQVRGREGLAGATKERGRIAVAA